MPSTVKTIIGRILQQVGQGSGLSLFSLHLLLPLVNLALCLAMVIIEGLCHLLACLRARLPTSPRRSDPWETR